jgi:hypothetical protein
MSETSVKERVARARGEEYADPDEEGLPSFESRPVVKSKLKLMGAGDGLSDALGLKSAAYELGDTIYLVVAAHVKRIEHEPMEKESDELARIHTTKVDTITEVSENDARAAWAAWAALTLTYASANAWVKHPANLLTVGIRDAYRSGLEIAVPTGPDELGWAMAE